MNQEQLNIIAKLIKKSVLKEVKKQMKKEIREEIKYALSLLNENTGFNNINNTTSSSNQNNENNKLDENTKSKLRQKYINELNFNGSNNIPNNNVTIQGHKNSIDPNSEQGKHLVEIQQKDYSALMKAMNK
jgi:hypothetical protein